MLLSDSARTCFRLVPMDWQRSVMTHGDDQFLTDAVKRMVLSEEEKKQSRTSGAWDLDRLGANPKLIAEVKLFRSWLKSIQHDEGRQKKEAIHSATVEQQRWIIHSCRGLTNHYATAIR
jgi:hypothetical protein